MKIPQQIEIDKIKLSPNRYFCSNSIESPCNDIREQFSKFCKIQKGNSPVSYNFAVESLKITIVFKPKLYKYPKDIFGLKNIRIFTLV